MCCFCYLFLLLCCWFWFLCLSMFVCIVFIVFVTVVFGFLCFCCCFSFSFVYICFYSLIVVFLLRVFVFLVFVVCVIVLLLFHAFSLFLLCLFESLFILLRYYLIWSEHVSWPRQDFLPRTHTYSGINAGRGKISCRAHIRIVSRMLPRQLLLPRTRCWRLSGACAATTFAAAALVTLCVGVRGKISCRGQPLCHYA